MNPETVLKIADIKLISSEAPNGHTTSDAFQNKVAGLKGMAFQLLLELQSLSGTQTPKVVSDNVHLENGVDFYEVVRRFEIDLIKGALQITGGHQIRAAQLLNLNATTLNSKIKHYKIGVEEFFPGYTSLENVKLQNRAQA